MEFRTWDQLTEEEQLLTEISDVYKDIHGFRPRSVLNGKSVEDLRSFLADLHTEAEATFIRNKQAQLSNVADFEELIKSTRAICSCDRSSAVRFLMDAEEDPDVEYIEFVYNLPYGYLMNEAA